MGETIRRQEYRTRHVFERRTESLRQGGRHDEDARLFPIRLLSEVRCPRSREGHYQFETAVAVFLCSSSTVGLVVSACEEELTIHFPPPRLRLQALDLGYKGYQLRMLILLPDDASKMGSIIDNLKVPYSVRS